MDGLPTIGSDVQQLLSRGRTDRGKFSRLTRLNSTLWDGLWVRQGLTTSVASDVGSWKHIQSYRKELTHPQRA